MRVVLVDDQKLVRQGFRLILAGEPDITVVGEATNGAEGVDVVKETAPDVVLMDGQMPVMDGVAATAKIREFSDVKGSTSTCGMDPHDRHVMGHRIVHLPGDPQPLVENCLLSELRCLVGSLRAGDEPRARLGLADVDRLCD